jgi:hypothetical protein
MLRKKWTFACVRYSLVNYVSGEYWTFDSGVIPLLPLLGRIGTSGWAKKFDLSGNVLRVSLGLVLLIRVLLPLLAKAQYLTPVSWNAPPNLHFYSTAEPLVCRNNPASIVLYVLYSVVGGAFEETRGI